MPASTVRRFTLDDLHQKPDGPALSVREVAVIWGLPESVIVQRVKNGELRGVQIGRCYKIPWRSLRFYAIRTRIIPLTGLA